MFREHSNNKVPNVGQTRGASAGWASASPQCQMETSTFKKTQRFSFLQAAVNTHACTHAHTGTHACAQAHAQRCAYSHTPTTPSPSRSLISSPHPMLSAEGSALGHSGLCFLTCGAARWGVFAAPVALLWLCQGSDLLGEKRQGHPPTSVPGSLPEAFGHGQAGWAEYLANAQRVS